MASTERGRWLAAAILVSCMALGGAPARAQFAGPLVRLIDADERDEHTNLAVEFSCSVRYVAHAPASHGSATSIRLRLGPDCPAGTDGAPQIPAVGGSSALNITARLEDAGLGDVQLTLNWGKALDFVLAPTSDGRGIRLRLLRAGRGSIGKVGVGEPAEAPEGYAVNLVSSREPIEAAAVQAAAAVLMTHAYVSELDIDDTHWYRLRVGPFTSRKEAERVLRAAAQRYPRAWVGINDETSTTVEAVGTSALPPGVGTGPTDPPLPEAERKRLLRDAQAAIRRRRYPQAIELLTKLLRQPEFPDRQLAQELLGLAHQRAGQLAQTKAAYEEYLRRYPEGVAAPRIRNRLRTLASAGRGARAAGDLGGGDRELGWNVAGTASQLYVGGRDQVEVGGASTDTTSVNVLLTDVDVLARRRGFRYDFSTRVSGGYTHGVGSGGGSDSGGTGSGRVSAFYAELADRQRGLAGRFGRQSHAGDGILGIFDGAFVSWQWKPALTLNVAAGLPADTARSGIDTGRQFLALSADFGPYAQAWDIGAFVVGQQIAGSADRRAVGFETRYFVPGRTAVLLVDYDFGFQALNSAILMGNWALPARWVLAFDLDHRRTPVLMLRNAIIGQPVSDFSALESLFTPVEIEQLARDRTPVTDALSLSLSRPLSERWQMMLDAFAMRTGATPDSGGVVGTPTTGLDRSLQLQFSGSSLLRASDLHFFGARVQQSPDQRSAMLMWNARFPLAGAWRIGPRLRVERREDDVTQSTQTLYLPEIRLDWNSQRSIFEFNAGGEIGEQQLPADTQRTRRLYFLLGYRLRF